MKGIIDGQNQLLETIQTNVAPIFNALAATVEIERDQSSDTEENLRSSDFAMRPAQRGDRNDRTVSRTAS